MPHTNPSPKIFKTTHRCSFIELDPFGHMNTVYYLAHYIEHRFTGMREESGLDLWPKCIYQIDIHKISLSLGIIPTPFIIFLGNTCLDNPVLRVSCQGSNRCIFIEILFRRCALTICMIFSLRRRLWLIKAERIYLTFFWVNFIH